MIATSINRSTEFGLQTCSAIAGLILSDPDS
jgi:hypothetical protein